jgi:hypothetical protein
MHVSVSCVITRKRIAHDIKALRKAIPCESEAFLPWAVMMGGFVWSRTIFSVQVRDD